MHRAFNFSAKCYAQLLSVIVTDCPRTHRMSHGKSQDFLALNPMLRQGLSCFQFSGTDRWGKEKRKEGKNDGERLF